jgi:hypothetical protein
VTTQSEVDLERLLTLRLVVARIDEMDRAQRWNTNGQRGRAGAMALSRGLPRTHHFAQARSVFAVAAYPCDEGLIRGPSKHYSRDVPASSIEPNDKRLSSCWSPVWSAVLSGTTPPERPQRAVSRTIRGRLEAAEHLQNLYRGSLVWP